jgi:hypothetical protein
MAALFAFNYQLPVIIPAAAAVEAWRRPDNFYRQLLGRQLLSQPLGGGLRTGISCPPANKF